MRMSATYHSYKVRRDVTHRRPQSLNKAFLDAPLFHSLKAQFSDTELGRSPPELRSIYQACS